MAKRIKVGEKVVGSTSLVGRYGTRQVVGKLVRILEKPDDYGRRYVVEVEDRLWLTGKKVRDTYRCF